MPKPYILTLACPDRVGIVATVSSFIANHSGSIIEANQHGDSISQWFFMRVVIDSQSLVLSLKEFKKLFESVASDFNMKWEIRDTNIKRKVILLVSKYDHCLVDILYRWGSGELDIDIPCVISNHEVVKDIVEWHGIPFHYAPIPKAAAAKKKTFNEIEKHLKECQADTIVLARFMQILPPELCLAYSGKLINIHHSFLPSFVGANPYEKAYLAGVKLIGATCHYVTEALDQGPIIEQDVIRVNHQQTIDDMVRLGRDIEKIVLARGLSYHLQNRVLVHDNKTIVFN